MKVLEKKQKNTELNFLYLDDKYQNKKTKNVKLKKKIEKNKKTKSKGKVEDTTFNFDNEIVIGVTKIPEEKNTKKINKKQDNKRAGVKSAPKARKTKTQKEKPIKKNTNNTRKKVTKSSENITKNKKKNTKKSVQAIIVKGIIKWTVLLTALVAAFIFFITSPLFNTATVEVVNNEKIATDTIVSLSEIKIGENIYKTSSKKIKENVKQNAYIESVEVSRKLPDKIQISVKERKTTYMLEFANSYAYINNQGYILEISQEKVDVPIISGYTTKEDEIKTGNRINNDDLEKLSTVLKIMESANGNGLQDLITKIEISNKQNYIIVLESKNKTAYLGDASNLSNRMLYLKAIMSDTEGLRGEIFVNGDLNKDNAFFRQKE